MVNNDEFRQQFVNNSKDDSQPAVLSRKRAGESLLFFCAGIGGYFLQIHGQLENKCLLTKL
ncbi:MULTISPECIES: hypothetical protein [Heyndrickxia]|uniref:hypothetical protein n=1 Tax=Heyndrickxia TaxID=2837504 RepID=UPI002DBC321A|nr:hypothetical protein [Weizmannia sp. CD-2023]MEC2224969.1 hypothetical protein [Weizmannia sp. CD-2023]